VEEVVPILLVGAAPKLLAHRGGHVCVYCVFFSSWSGRC